MAKLDASRLESAGGGNVAVGAQFKPYMTKPAVSPSSQGFVGPTAVSAPATNQAVSSPSPSNLPGQKATSTPTSTPTPKATPTPAVSYVPPKPPVVKPKAPVKNLAPYVNPKQGPNDTAMSWDSTVTAEEKARSAASGKAARQFAFELTGIPSAYRLSTGKYEPVAGSKSLGVGLDVVSLIPLVGGIGKVAKVSGALGKTAKTVGAANATVKGAKVLKDVAGAKVAAGVAASAMTLAPTAGNISDAMKAGTSITQSIDAAKTTAKTVAKADTFTPGISKTSKVDSVADVKAPPKNVKAEGLDPVKVKAASDTLAKTGATAAVTNAVTKASAPTAATSAVAKADAAAQTSAAGTRVDDFRVGTGSDYTAKGQVDKIKDVKETKDIKDTTAYTNVNDVVNAVKPFQAAAHTGGHNMRDPEGTRPPKTPAKKPRRKPRLRLNDDSGRQWRPSSII